MYLRIDSGDTDNMLLATVSRQGGTVHMPSDPTLVVPPKLLGYVLDGFKCASFL